MTPIEWAVVIFGVMSVLAFILAVIAVFGTPDETWIKDKIQSDIKYHDERPYAHLPMRQAIEKNYNLSHAGPDTNPGWSIRNASREDRALSENRWKEHTGNRIDRLTELVAVHDMRLDAVEFAIDPDEFPIRAEDI